MAVCRFDTNYQMFDITPVDNMFIEDYMTRANGDFVKVYLYGLRLCYTREECDLQKMASVLGMTEELIIRAFAYWERQKLVVRMSDNPPSFSYVNLRAMLSRNVAEPVDTDIYTMASFNQALMRLIPSRAVHNSDFVKLYDILTESGMNDTGLLMIIEDMAKKNKEKGKNEPTIDAIRKKAKEFEGKNIITDDAIREHLKRESSGFGEIKILLRHIGIIKDAPSMIEEEMYYKWKDMGYTLDTLKLLSSEMVKIQKPTFDYLDKIVQGYYDKGLIEENDIIRFRDVDMKPVENIRSELAVGGQTTDELFRLYVTWTGKGVEEDLILEAARDAKKYARGNRVVYLTRTIEKSLENNIKTLESYIAEREKKAAARAQGKSESDRNTRLSKPVAAQNYNQRQYEEKDLEGNLFDLEHYGEDKQP